MPAQSKQIKRLVQAILLKSLLRLFSLLPLRLCHLLGAAIGLLAVVLPTELRRVTRLNIDRCLPELSQAERNRLTRRSLIRMGSTIAETGPVWFWAGSRLQGLVRKVSGEQYLAEGMARGDGVILAAPHLGCWEMIGAYCSMRYPMITLYRPPRLQQLDSVMKRARNRFGGRLAPTDSRGVRQLYQALGRGELVGILPDQEPAGGHGLFAPFFGVEANTMVLLSRLARQSGATVLFTYAERLPRGNGYHIHFVPAPAGVDDADLQTAVTHINLGVEQCIRNLPEQYQWSYKRFRSRPPGEPPVY
ncbi:MAG: lysophospholipid acyltransferase family protein [Acidiferrobacterales bacterium]